MPYKHANKTRRDFLKTSTGIAVGATLAGALAVARGGPAGASGKMRIVVIGCGGGGAGRAREEERGVHAGTSEKMRIGLIGCGGRGTAAAENALVASPENVLVAVGDTFADFANGSLDKLRRKDEVKNRVQVPADHVFVGFDAYKK